MTIEELRQALLQLTALDAQKESFRAHMAGKTEEYQQEFNALMKKVQDAIPGWELQKMRNPWITTWAIFPVKE